MSIIFAVWLGTRHPTAQFTYGMRRASILSALANAVILLVVTGAIALEAARRLANPVPTEGFVIMGVSLAGIAVNGVSAWLLASGRERDLNLRAAFAHMVADAGLTAGVAVAGVVIALTGWNRLDAAVSLILAGVIVAGTWELLRESVSLSLDAVPEGIDPDAVAAWLRALPGVSELHDLHIWGLSTTETALTAHLVREDAPGDPALLARVPVEARERFGGPRRIGQAFARHLGPGGPHFKILAAKRVQFRLFGQQLHPGLQKRARSAAAGIVALLVALPAHAGEIPSIIPAAPYSFKPIVSVTNFGLYESSPFFSGDEQAWLETSLRLGGKFEYQCVVVEAVGTGVRTSGRAT